jgi:cyclic beta-1,2-glucan synthetase
VTEADPTRRTPDPSPIGCPGLDGSRQWDDPSCLRGDIFSAERLTEHAQELARAHGEVSLRIPAGRLSARIRAARDRILHAYAMLARDPRTMRNPSPAEEWLFDNSHIVSDQLREIDEDLPWGYLVKLPRLTTGRMRGYPRVYGLCVDYLRHTDARIDPETLAQYVLSYQTVSPLAIGELWAVPILLRLGLILTTGALASTEADALNRSRGEKQGDRLSHPPGAGTPQPFEPSPESEPPRSAEQDLRRQHARQAADHVLIGNAITSMRTIAALEWRKFFEKTSLVESILRQDPGSVYGSTDDASRDRYRHEIEKLAERSGADERSVAMAALALARAAEHDAADSPWARHVGHYLVDSGRRRLEGVIGYRPTRRERVVRALLDHPGVFYFCTLSLVCAGFLGAWATDLTRHLLERGAVVGLLFLALLPMSEMAVAFVNALTVTMLPPRVLSKLSFRDGVPPEHCTLVVVPALVDGEESLAQLLARLEVRALANSDPNVHFALLSDLPDSDVLECPADADLVLSAKAGIEELNRRHAGPR